MKQTCVNQTNDRQAGARLQDMPLEELWELFPISLSAHRDCWAAWYEEERDRLLEELPAQGTVRISHIGSTSVETIWAKPIVDILLEIGPWAEFPAFAGAVERCGYIPMSGDGNRASFNRGYTPAGFAGRVFHLHLRFAGDNDELYFRDYLRDHADVALSYEKLKNKLWREYEHDRDAYTQGKTDFVRECTRRARELYGDIY